MTGPVLPPGGSPPGGGASPPTPGAGGGMPNLSSAGAMASKMPGMAEKIDNLPMGTETALKLLQNPVVAALASVVITAMTGTPVSPNQVMMGAEVGHGAVKARREEKELEASNGPKMGD